MIDSLPPCSKCPQTATSRFAVYRVPKGTLRAGMPKPTGEPSDIIWLCDEHAIEFQADCLRYEPEP